MEVRVIFLDVPSYTAVLELVQNICILQHIINTCIILTCSCFKILHKGLVTEYFQTGLSCIDLDAESDSTSISHAGTNQSRAQDYGEYTNWKHWTLFHYRQKSHKVILHAQQARKPRFEKTEDDRLKQTSKKSTTHPIQVFQLLV